MIQNEDIQEWIAENNGEFNPEMDDDLVRLKREELQALAAKSWNDTLLQFAQRDEQLDKLEDRVVGTKSANWRTCAVGESLRDIAGVQDAPEGTAVAYPDLETCGSRFHIQICKEQWDDAADTLAEIQAFVRGNKEDICKTENKILDNDNSAWVV